MTREGWLEQAAWLIMDQLVGKHGLEPAQWRVSCGWPSRGALSASRRRVGECWPPEACTDRLTHHVFISPLLAEEVDGTGDGVLPTLVHELVHVVAGEPGHRGRFRQIGKAVGLEGKMASSLAGPVLCEKLREMVVQLGPYPHAGIDVEGRGRRVQSTRMIKLVTRHCTECEYAARTTRVWLATFGPPKCPHGSPMEEVT